MQTRDDVEAGDEKIKELESEMREIGLYDTDFSLGDILLEEAEEEGENGKPGGETRKKKKLDDFPSVEGEESLVEYIGQYKKACLNRKALLKSSKERLEKDNAKDYQTFGCTATYSNFFWGWLGLLLKNCGHQTLDVYLPPSSMLFASHLRNDLDALSKVAGC